MSNIVDIEHYSKCSCPADDNHTCMSGSTDCDADLAYCHFEADTTTFGYSATTWSWYVWSIRTYSSIWGSCSSWASYSIWGGYSSRVNYASWGDYYSRGRDSYPEHSRDHSKAIISTWSSHHYLIIYLLFVFTYYRRNVNPMFFMFYILGLDVLLVHISYCTSLK